jgi:intraflagellar transport protein 172
VKRLSTGAFLVLRSGFGLEITKINIHQDTFVIAHTAESILLGQLETCKLSEIPWRGGGNEKFLLENPQVGSKSVTSFESSIFNQNHSLVTWLADE